MKTKSHELEAFLPSLGEATDTDSEAQEGMLLDVLLAPSPKHALHLLLPGTHPFLFEVLKSNHSLVRSQNDLSQN